jgi:hypothetical protein
MKSGGVAGPVDEKTDVEENRVWERADEKSEKKKEPLEGGSFLL